MHTPGHASNHLCFALAQEGSLFSGDHVMAWSTTVVAPPDGDMAAYMALAGASRRARGGGLLSRPRRARDRGAALRARPRHAQAQREGAILARLVAGDEDIATIVTRIYAGLDPRLVRAASLSVLAHLQDMTARGTVTSSEGAATMEARYTTCRP